MVRVFRFGLYRLFFGPPFKDALHMVIEKVLQHEALELESVLAE
jgi:hypothetical protein